MVVGLLDGDLSERLQLLSDLDLATAVTKARNSEAVKAQQATVRGSQATPTPLLFLLTLCTAMPNRTGHNANVLPEKKRNDYPSNSMPSSRKCQWCGYDKHPRGKCPARNSKCLQCSKIGHFASVCRSTAAHFVSAAFATVQDDAFLNLLDSGNAWSKQVDVGDSQILMKIGTRTDVTAIPEKLYINNAWFRDMHFKYPTVYCADLTATNFPSQGASKSPFRVPFQMLFCRTTRSTLYVDYRHLFWEDQLYKVAHIRTSQSHQRTPHRHQERPDVFPVTLFRTRKIQRSSS